MKYFPGRLNITWIKNCYADGSLTPRELIEEIIKRAELTKDKNVWIVPPSKELMERYIEKLEKTDANSLPLWGSHLP